MARQVKDDCTASTPAELLARIEGSDEVVADQWQVQVQARIQQRARVLLKTDGLTAAQVRGAHLVPVDDIEAAVTAAMREAGPYARLCVIPQGPQTIPYVA
jgi:hypothetical protein